ncbi:MAG: phosphatidylserine/phosphatidylglycerophosphate/cardiolipin synthase family protein [Deltaproteobacteria bacterium]|nr:phosphatidylserine/phosphatidylglycerophosphate/cardiolipin synthase family protein [Deltaproteobacteria bacterium]
MGPKPGPKLGLTRIAELVAHAPTLQRILKAAGMAIPVAFAGPAMAWDGDGQESWSPTGPSTTQASSPRTTWDDSTPQKRLEVMQKALTLGAGFTTFDRQILSGRPDDASRMSRTPQQLLDVNPRAFAESPEVRVHRSRNEPGALYLEVGPKEQSTEPVWMKLAPKSGASAGPTDADRAKLERVGQSLGLLLGIDRAYDEALPGRLEALCSTYKIPTSAFAPTSAVEFPLDGKPTPFLEHMNRLHRSGQLDAFVRELVDSLIPPSINRDGTLATTQDRQANVVRNQQFSSELAVIIRTELQVRGMAPLRNGTYMAKPADNARTVWERLRQIDEVLETVRDSSFVPYLKPLGARQKFPEAVRKDVLDAFARIATNDPHKTVSTAREVDVLSGQEALNARFDQIRRATEAAKDGHSVVIDVETWKLYGDKPADPERVGERYAELLAAAGRAGAKLNLLVDGRVAKKDPESQKLLDMLAKLPRAKVTRSTPELNTPEGAGHHAKVVKITIDGRPVEVLAGGTNVHGDYFVRWFDVDAMYKGGGFVDEFGEERAPRNRRNSSRIDPKAEVVGFTAVDDPARPTLAGITTQLGLIKLAGSPVTIMNAYLLPLFPGAEFDVLTELLKEEVARGKRIDIVTNSPASIDTRILGGAMVQYAAALLKEVNGHAAKLRSEGGNPGVLTLYLRPEKDATLHAKTISDPICAGAIGSPNFHARWALEAEKLSAFVSCKATDELDALARKLKAEARPYTDSSALLKDWGQRTPTYELDRVLFTDLGLAHQY